METDETGTLARLEALHGTVTDPAVARHCRPCISRRPPSKARGERLPKLRPPAGLSLKFDEQFLI
jgi:hypothetical protein